MTAREYRDLLLQRWWIVGLSILLVGLGAVTVTLFPLQSIRREH